MSFRPIAVIAGVGNATGTGAAVAREFAKTLGYRVALIARKPEYLNSLAEEISKSGGEALPIPIESYSFSNIQEVFKKIKETWPDPENRVKACIWNTAQWSRIPFLEVKEADIKRSVDINVVAAFAFAQEAIKAMLSPSPNTDPASASRPSGSPPSSKNDSPSSLLNAQGGSLIFTGATSATRGAANFATFAAGKHGLRALSQSLSREFGKKDIHVSFVIVDGVIRTHRTRQNFSRLPRPRSNLANSAESPDPEGQGDEDGWFDDPRKTLSPESIAKAYTWLHQQEPSAWTLELDLRPAHEHF